MDNPFSDVVCGDDYTQAATIQDVFDSKGGYAIISGADAFMRRQYGSLGENYWTDEVHVSQGNVELFAGTIGVQFRNFIAGVPATVSAEITHKPWPGFSLSASGAASSAVSGLPVVNPQTYGAKFDGTTDDLAAINRAISHLPSTGGILYLPGIAAVSNVVDLTANTGCVVAGPLALGLGVTFPFIGGLKALASFPANTPLIKQAYGAATDVRTLICGISLDGNNVAQDGYLGTNVSGPRFVGVSFRNFLRDGSRVTGAVSNGEWFDCYTLNCADAGYYYEGIYGRFVRAHSDGAGNYGIFFTSNNNGACLIAQGHYEAHTIAGISCNGIGGGHRIVDNQFITSISGAHGIDLNGTGPGIKVRGNSMAGETAAGTQVGISSGSPGGNISSNSIDGYTTQILNSALAATIADNVLSLSPTTGIRIDTGSSTPVVIDGNTCRNAPASVNIASGAVSFGQNYFSGTVTSTYNTLTVTGAGYAQLGGGAKTCGYKINPDRTVTLVVEVTTGAAGVTIFTLPAEARPTATLHWTARGDDGVGTGAVFGRILSTGVVVADTVRGGAGPQLGFSITYPID